jgi:hypothetical protein
VVRAKLRTTCRGSSRWLNWYPEMTRARATESHEN